MSLGGTRLSIPEIYSYAVQGGFPPGMWAALATATAMTESSGWTQAVSSTGASGLWQIIHGNYASMGYNQEQAFDPALNAKMAHQLWQNRGGASVSPGQAFADWWPYDGGPGNPYWGSYIAAATNAAASGDVKGPITGPGSTVGGSSTGVGSPGSGLGGGVTHQPVVHPGTYGTYDPSTGQWQTGGSENTNTIIGGNIPDWFTSTYNWLQGIVGDAGNFIHASLWLINPSNWVRIVAGVAGVAAFISGAILIATAA